jgi:transcriptional regulator with XRE-family HTH domain
MAAKKSPNDSSGMAKRLRELMAAKGYNQQQLENAIGASKGYLSRLINEKRGQKISPEYLTSLASVLDVTPNYLRWGVELEEGAIMTPAAGLSPRIEELPGYREAEFAAIRQHPDIPFHIFEEARQARFVRPPQTVTEKYLSELVRFLASSSHGVDQTDAVKSTLDKTTRTKTGRP